MKLKSLHGQVMVKSEICNIISAPKMISDQIICVKLNAGADPDRFIRFAQNCQNFSQKFFIECFVVKCK